MKGLIFIPERLNSRFSKKNLSKEYLPIPDRKIKACIVMNQICPTTTRLHTITIGSVYTLELTRRKFRIEKL